MRRGVQEASVSFCDRSSLQKALDLLSCSLHPAPSSTYIRILAACVKSRSLTIIRLLHVHVFLLEASLSLDVGQHLVVALAKCGAVNDALHVSCSLSHRTVVSWTAIISAFANRGDGVEALRVYDRMLEDGIEPDQFTFSSLFQACGTAFDLLRGRAIHADARDRGFTQDVFMASTLIGMYSKCRSISEAENVFEATKEYDIVTLNTMLAAYVEHGQTKKALQLYLMMEEYGVCSNDRTYVPTLQACTMVAEGREMSGLCGILSEATCLQLGQVVHAHAETKGFTLNIFVGNCLLTMYGKNGALEEANYVFSTLPERTNVSWNSILSAYVAQGQAVKALGLYTMMVSQDVGPDHLTLVLCLQACSSFVSKECSMANSKTFKHSVLNVGRALHSDARKRGYMSFVMVCNTVISLYGKCGAVAKAEHVFGEVSNRNEVSYNVMISTYNEQGQGEKALQLYAHMELEGVSPDEGTFVHALQACTLLTENKELELEDPKSNNLKPLCIGLALHAETQLRGFTSDNYLNSTLVSMYGKCGAIMEAEHVFLADCDRTLVMWNAMISSYVIQGQEVRALQLYRQMLEEGLAPDQLTYATAILACAVLVDKSTAPYLGQQHQAMSLDIGYALHADVKRRGLICDTYVGSSLMSLYDRHRCITKVEQVFAGIIQPDTASWNAMLSAYLEWGMERELLQLFAHMSKKNVTSDEQTLVIALQACAGILGKEFVPHIGKKIIQEMPLGIACGVYEQINNAGYAGNANVKSAIISVCSKLGAIAEAEAVFNKTGNHTVSTWTAMIAANVGHGDGVKALDLYAEMQEHCVSPNHITMTCILQACVEAGSLETCRRIHFDIVSVSYDQNLFVSTTLLYVYGTQTSMAETKDLFAKLPAADMISWNAYIGGHVGRGDGLASLQALEHLTFAGSKPDKLTLTLVLAACSRSGLVCDGLEYFISSRHKYNLCQDFKHQAAILDLLGRAGDLRQAKNLFETMPLKPGQDTFFSLLGACRAHGNPELAEQIFAIATTDEFTQATAYILMANVYAEVTCHENHTYMG